MSKLKCLLGLHDWEDRFRLSHLDGTGAYEVTVCMSCGKLTDPKWPPDNE